MSDTTPHTKTPLWKQLLGAATGAALAFMVYQGYTFTANHLTALVTLPQGSGIMDRSVPPQPLRPTGTWDSTTGAAASSSAVSLPIFVSLSSSSAALPVSAGLAPANAVIQTLPTPSSAESSSSSSQPSLSVEPPIVTKPLIAGMQWSSSSLSPMPVETVADSIPAEPAYRAPALPMQAHAGTLPQSGFGLDVLAVAALGAVLGRKKVLRK